MKVAAALHTMNKKVFITKIVLKWIESNHVDFDSKEEEEKEEKSCEKSTPLLVNHLHEREWYILLLMLLKWTGENAVEKIYKNKES